MIDTFEQSRKNILEIIEWRYEYVEKVTAVAASVGWFYNWHLVGRKKIRAGNDKEGK